MRFKVDENLPVELAEKLREAGHEAVTVFSQRLTGAADFDLAEVCRSESRAMITLDLDFADIRTYPPESYPGLIVLRIARQDKLYVLSVFRKVLKIIRQEPLKGRLWIVGEERIRIR